MNEWEDGVPRRETLRTRPPSWESSDIGNPYTAALVALGGSLVVIGIITMVAVESSRYELLSTGQVIGAGLFGTGVTMLISWLMVSAVTWTLERGRAAP
jgi:hypothetical protein